MSAAPDRDTLIPAPGPLLSYRPRGGVMSAVTGDRVLVRAVRHGGPWVAVLVLAALAVAAADLLLPAALGAAVDAALTPGARPGRWIAAAVALIVVIAVAEILTGLAAGLSTARATARLRHALVGHVFALAPD